MRVKICGITQIQQAEAIAEMGATALGFICVSASPRYVEPSRIRAIADRLPDQILRVGVFANESLDTVASTVAQANLSAVQLHGSESPEFCQQLRQRLPGIELLKAFRIKTPDALAQVETYRDRVDSVLLDAYHPDQLGGTGRTLEWQRLNTFSPSQPWWLAGGLTPDNIRMALAQVRPDGIDLSSGVETAPGDKNLTKVARLFETLQSL
jgi:phosphoribosylanthranilate isomerase